MPTSATPVRREKKAHHTVAHARSLFDKLVHRYGSNALKKAPRDVAQSIATGYPLLILQVSDDEVEEASAMAAEQCIHVAAEHDERYTIAVVPR
jgi:hypothetical protein